MADSDRNGGQAGAAGAGAGSPAAGGTAGEEQKAPVFRAVSQYIKDLSFENPNAPGALGKPIPGGGIKLQVNVNARPLNESNYEVDLKIEARAGTEDEIAFNLELAYAGVFHVENVKREQIHPLIMIEGPRLLFPFARQIIADAARSGGYPPLLLDPIDFAALYRQRVAQMRSQAQPGEAGAQPPGTQTQ